MARVAGIFGCLISLLVTLSSRADEKKITLRGKDPAGTTLLMGQLRMLFADWDINKDGFLDRNEVAKAFRGTHAKPLEIATTKKDEKAAVPAKEEKPSASKYPDYYYLIELDQNGDGKISKSEFTDWARAFAREWKKILDAERRLAQAERKLEAQLLTAERHKITTDLQKERKALATLRQDLKFLDTIERQLQQPRK